MWRLPARAPRRANLFLAVFILLAAGCARPRVELIPRSVLFGNPDRVKPRLSPDGRKVAYLAPLDGVQNIWIRTVGEEDDHPITEDQGRGIYSLVWAYDNRHVAFIQDRDADENWRLYSVDVTTGEIRSFFPKSDVRGPMQTRLLYRCPCHPEEVMVGVNNRDPSVFDIYRVNLNTGETRLIQRGIKDAVIWLFDSKMDLRGALRAEDDAGQTLLLRDGPRGPFREEIRWGLIDDISWQEGFTPDGKGLYLRDSRGRNTSALVRYDLKTKQIELLAEDPVADVSKVYLHPGTGRAQFVTFLKDRLEYKVLDPAVEGDLRRIRASGEGDAWIIDRTPDTRYWLIAYESDTKPVRYAVYDSADSSVTTLFVQREALVGRPLAPMQPVQIQSRDGFTLYSYLTRPIGRKKAGPLVILAHGGGLKRDIWGYNPEAQWLANRGYACLQVNYRGTYGFGKKFMNAGNRELGRKVLNDFSDAARWAVDAGIADPDKIAIYGGSIGGYFALACATFTPDLYRAAVSAVGLVDLVSYVQYVPPIWRAYLTTLDARIGRYPRYDSGPRAGEPKEEADWTAQDSADVEFLRAQSPFYNTDQVKIPLFIAGGDKDSRVPKELVEEYVKRLRKSGVQVEYISYPNEGHGFRIEENRLDFYRRAEQFLAEHLGGRVEQ